MVRSEIGYQYKEWTLVSKTGDRNTQILEFSCPRCKQVRLVGALMFQKIRVNKGRLDCQHCNYGGAQGRRSRYYTGGEVLGWKIVQCEKSKTAKLMHIECPDCHRIVKIKSTSLRRRERFNNPAVCPCGSKQRIVDRKVTLAQALKEFLSEAWIVGELNEKFKAWHMSVECKSCGHKHNPTLRLIKASKESGSPYPCSHCKRKAVKRPSRARVPNVLPEGWHVDNTTPLKRGYTFEARCGKCNTPAIFTSFKANFHRGRKENVPCDKCEVAKIISLQIPDWVVTKGTVAQVSKWRVTHKCGYTRRARLAEIERAAIEKSLRCSQCAYRPKMAYINTLMQGLNETQRLFVNTALSTRKRNLDGVEVGSPEEAMDELRETVEMCKRWSDERCRQEIADILRKPEFKIELKTSYAPYYGGEQGNRTQSSWA